MTSKRLKKYEEQKESAKTAIFNLLRVNSELSVNDIFDILVEEHCSEMREERHFKEHIIYYWGLDVINHGASLPELDKIERFQQKLEQDPMGDWF